MKLAKAARDEVPVIKVPGIKALYMSGCPAFYKVSLLIVPGWNLMRH